MHLYEIFGSDTLLSYLADHLKNPTCTITKDSGCFYLGSSYIDTLIATGNIGTEAQGIFSVLKLINTNFDQKIDKDKEDICIEGILSILNGLIKVKYNHFGLERIHNAPLGATIAGKVINIFENKKIFSVSKSIPMRIRIQAPYSEFEDADKQKYTGRDMWDIAMNNAIVARVLHYFAKAEVEDRSDLRKVREEIYGDNRDWFKQAVEHKLEYFDQWADNPYIGGDKALHALSAGQKERAKGINDTPTSPINFRDIIMQWINTK
jgi:hypothetical protein